MNFDNGRNVLSVVQEIRAVTLWYLVQWLEKDPFLQFDDMEERFKYLSCSAKRNRLKDFQTIIVSILYLALETLR